MTHWRGVRWNPTILEWEMRCDLCSLAKQAAWWPLAHEFWDFTKGLSRCRACWNAYQRAYTAGTRRAMSRQSAATRTERLAARRAYSREWAARKRADDRAAEGRGRYERRRAA